MCVCVEVIYICCVCVEVYPGSYGHEKPGKSWNFKTAFSRPGKVLENE